MCLPALAGLASLWPRADRRTGEAVADITSSVVSSGRVSSVNPNRPFLGISVPKYGKLQDKTAWVGGVVRKSGQKLAEKASLENKKALHVTRQRVSDDVERDA